MTRHVTVRSITALLFAVFTPPVLSQTEGIVTDKLYLNYDTDLTPGGWTPTVTPADSVLLDMTSGAAVQDITAPVHLNIDSMFSINTGVLTNGFTVGTGAANDTWGGNFGCQCRVAVQHPGVLVETGEHQPNTGGHLGDGGRHRKRSDVQR